MSFEESTAAAVADPTVIDGEFTEMVPAAVRGGGLMARPEMSPDSLREEIARQKEMRQIMTEYVRDAMKEGHHYYSFNTLGKENLPANVPKDKPALTQEGAYLICGLFRCFVGEVVTQIIREDGGHFTVVAKAPINNQNGVTIAVGDGTCTTRETKYAFRKGERACPECGAPAVIKGKDFSGQNKPAGWVCFAKKGGCGAKFPNGDERIETQSTGRVENPDLADLENTVLKMAVKRATVAGVKKLPLVSELFATDPNDNAPAPAAAETGTPRQNARSRSASPAPQATVRADDKVATAVRLSKQLLDRGIEMEQLVIQFLPEGVATFEALTPEQAAEAIPAMAELLNNKLDE